MSSIPYRPEIDGLRAIAVAGVVAYHLNPQFLPGGFLGVDVFFVISGYLIASIVLKQKEAGTFTYRDFWARRIKRIIPALAFMISATLIAGWLLMFPPNLQLLGQQAFGAITFHANHVSLWLTNGYWGNTAESLPLLHTWSLGVEEQFYILFPFFIGLLLRQPRERQMGAISLLILISFAACVILTVLRPAHAFYWLPTRAWQIGVGVFLALLRKPHHEVGRESCFATPALLGLACTFVFIEGGKDFPGWKAAIPTVLTAIFIHGSGPSSVASNILTSPPMLFLGKASYSIYLWHWPIIVLFKQSTEKAHLKPSDVAVVMALVAALASFSYLMIERLGKNLRKPFVFATFCIVALGSMSVWVRYGPVGNVVILDEYRAEWRGGLYDSFKGRRVDFGTKGKGVTMILPESSADADDGIGRRFAGGPKKVLIIGDSHASAAASALERSMQRAGYAGAFMVADGLKPYPGSRSSSLSIEEARSFIEKQVKYALGEKPHLVVLVVRADMSPAVSRAVLDHVRQLTEPSQARVLVVGQPPLLPIGDVSAPAWFSWYREKHGRHPVLTEDPNLDLKRQKLYFEEQVLSEYGFLLFQAAPRLLDKEGIISTTSELGLNYIDDDHLSEFGWRLLEPELDKFIEANGL